MVAIDFERGLFLLASISEVSMKSLWFVFFFPVVAFSELTPIENPELICQDKGVQVAFEGYKERVWQADPGEKSGLQMKVSSFQQIMRMPYDWEVIGVLELETEFGKFELPTKYRTRSRWSSGRQPKPVVKLDIFTSRDGEKFKLIKKNISCQVVVAPGN